MSSTIHKATTIHQSRIFRLVHEHLTLPSGHTTEFDIIRHPGASMIVPLIDANTLVLISQYRHALGEFIWEMPAGTLDPNESPLECAQREIQEEIGYKASTWHELGMITPVPAYSDERIYIFLAMDLTPISQNLDQDEIIDVHPIPLQKALDMVYRGEIYDSKTISALFLTRHWIDQKLKNGL